MAVNMDVVLAEWKARTLAEYRSASLAAEFQMWLIRLGFSVDVIQQCHEIVGHELAHSDLCWEVYATLGGEDDPLDCTEGSLAIPNAFGEPTFDRLVLACIDHWCVAETLAGPLYEAMTDKVAKSGPKKAVTRLAKDTKAHASFGWAVLDEAIEQDDEYVLDIAKKAIPGFLSRVEGAWGIIPDGWKEPVGPEEGKYGLIPRAVYKRCFYQSIADSVLPELDARNLPGRAAWSKRKR